MRLQGEPPPPGGGTPFYKPYRYVPPQRVWVLGRFDLKTGIDFAYFGLELGMVFEGTLGVYKHIYHFSFEWPRKKEKYAKLKWILRGQEARSENGYGF